ncbi:type II secretion system protein GspM [Glaciecola siphonariae]|uniref:Type II secretion system protein GspM n=1 Tax=Glaciecola siphonariae TaxID=521012 RepID=A0ABV9LX75_9ALTE
MPQTNTTKNVSSMAVVGEKFEALAPREKRLIFIAIPALVIFVLTLLVLEPMYKDIKNAKARFITQSSQLSTLQQTSAELMSEVQKDPDAAVKRQISALESQLENIQASFDSELVHLVSPKAMPLLLEHLFERAEGLKLIKMESIPPTRVFTDQSEQGAVQLYRQGIHITFQGDYFATRDFFADAETLKWQLYWKYLHYDVHSHPLATTQLEVFTLSTSEAFIGVN